MNDLPGGRGGRFALALWALCTATSAAAQVDTAVATSPAATVSAPVENGIRMGEGRVHPYFDLETHYDSAAWTNTAGNQILGEVVNHFRPGFRLDLPASAVDMSLNANVDYVWYTGLINPQDKQASRLEAGADLAANFNKSGPVGFDVGDRFSRSDRTTNAAIAIGVISLFNEIRAGIPIKPGGGALEVDPNVAYAVEFFSPIAGNSPLQDPKTFNYQNVRFGLGGRYRFLPKTAIILDASYDLRSYFSAGNLPAQLLKAETGLAGLVSPKIALLLKLGWAQDFAGRARSLIGHGELSYLLNERSNVKFGYLRSIDPVPLFGSFGDDRGYVEANLIMAEKLRMQGYAAFDYLTYYGVARHDTSVMFTLSPEYTLTRWFKLGAAYTLSVRSSDQVTSATLNFTRHEGLLRATFQY